MYSTPGRPVSLPLDPAQGGSSSFLDPAFRRVVHPSYLRLLDRHLDRTGKFAFVCARCRRPVGRMSRLYLDVEGGFGFGTDCWAVIHAKQSALQIHRGRAGKGRAATASELVGFECRSTGLTFRALPENRRHCGVEPVSCAACPGTSPRNRNRLCDFELAANDMDVE